MPNKDYFKNYRRTHKVSPKSHHTWNKKFYWKLRKKALILIGSKCIICNSTKKLLFHEIHGKEHIILKERNVIKDTEYYIEHYKDFISLCYKHHLMLHLLAILNKEQITKILHYRKILRKMKYK